MTVHSITRRSTLIPALLLTVAVLVLGAAPVMIPLSRTVPRTETRSRPGDRGAADGHRGPVREEPGGAQAGRTAQGRRRPERGHRDPGGKRIILDILINNEIQAMKAIELGYDDDEAYQERTTAISEFSAGA